jgi:hypothetical protein
MQYAVDFSCKTQQLSSYFPQSMFKIFYGDGIYQICSFDDVIYLIENLVTGLLVEHPLVV